MISAGVARHAVQDSESENETQRSVDRVDLLASQRGERASQKLARHEGDRVQVHLASVWHAIVRRQQHAAWKSADRPRDLRDDDSGQQLICGIAVQEQHRARAGWRRKLSPPDLSSPHSLRSQSDGSIIELAASLNAASLWVPGVRR